MSRSLVGSIVILFLSPLIEAEKGTSAPLASPTFRATLPVKSVISESSIFLNLPLEAISKFAEIETSVAPFVGL